MSDTKGFTSLADLTIVDRDGQKIYQWAIKNKPRAGQPKGPAVDPRAGTTLTVPYTGDVALTPGTYSVRFGLDREGEMKIWGVTPTDVRFRVDFRGFPTVMFGLREGIDPNPVVEGAYGRYVMADFEVNDPKSPYNGLQFRAFLNVEVADLTKTNRGLVTRSVVRKALGLGVDADLALEMGKMRDPNVKGSEWVKLNDLALKTVTGLSAKLDGTGKLVELADTDDVAALKAKLQAELAALV